MPFAFSRDKSIPQVFFDLATNNYPGVYLTWERLTPDDLSTGNTITLGVNSPQRMYVITRSSQLNGVYQEIGRIPVPQNEFIDDSGKPGYFYIIKLIQVDLGTNAETLIASTTPITGDELLINVSLAYEVKNFLDIPVRDDTIEFNSGRTSGSLSYSNIVFTPGPEIKISVNSNSGLNDSIQTIDPNIGIPYSLLVVGDPTIDYTVVNNAGVTVPINNLYYQIAQNGRIFFYGDYQGVKYPVKIPSYEILYATYRVKMFTVTEMNDALYQALQYINARPGSQKYTSLRNTPYYYDAALITIATYYLIRRLIMRLTQREIRLLLGDLGDTGGSNYTDGIATLKDMMAAYKEDMDKLATNAALAFYPKIGTISTQTYQLPGSRSYMFRSMFGKAEGGYG